MASDAETPTADILNGLDLIARYATVLLRDQAGTVSNETRLDYYRIILDECSRIGSLIRNRQDASR